MPEPGLAIDPLVSAALAVAAAFAMGFAIQRGGTCMVAAVEQIYRAKSASKLLALLECSLWTSVLGFGALSAGLRFTASPDFSPGLTAIVGGLLLGLGASVNGACVFGSVARIGSRDFNYLLALPGFFLGSLAHHLFIGTASVMVRGIQHDTRAGPLIVLLVACLVFGLVHAWRNARTSGMFLGYRLATVSIGFAFVLLAVVSGPWTYTEVFARAAHGGAGPSLLEATLLGALLAGAVVGGGNGTRGGAFRIARAVQCLAGGALMGVGSAMIPGGNDNLILIGIPAFQSHAWLAICSMVLAIAIWLKLGAFRRNLGEVGRAGRANST